MTNSFLIVVMMITCACKDVDDTWCITETLCKHYRGFMSQLISWIA